MDYKFWNSTNHSTFNNAFNVTNSLNQSTSNEILFDIHTDQDYFGFIETSLSLLGAVLNISIIINLLTMTQSLKTQFKLILSLAISDCLIAMFHFILRFFRFPNFFKFSTTFIVDFSAFRLILSFIYVCSQYAGLGTMCTIAVDVLIKVRTPFKYRILMSKARGNVIIICLWVIPLLLFITAALILMYFLGDFFASLFPLFMLCGGFYFILCILFLFIFTIIYTVIFCSVRRRLRSNQRRTTSKMAVTFFLIIISYFICMVPFVWGALLSYTITDNFYTVSTFVTCLYILNTSIDPIIYAVRVPEIRARFRKICNRVFHFPRSFRGNIRN